LDGYIKDATLKDASGQVATYNGTGGRYTFSSSPVYPLTLTGGRYEDTNDTFDINLTAQSGEVISPITTFLENNSTLLEKLANLGLVGNPSTYNDFAKDYVESNDIDLAKLSQLLYVVLKYPSLTSSFKQSIENNTSLDTIDKLFTLAEVDINSSTKLNFKQKYYARKLLAMTKAYTGADSNASSLIDNFLSGTILSSSDILSDNSEVNLEKFLQYVKRSLDGNYSLQKKSPLIVKTGQTISYKANDDGDLQKGVARSYTRDDVKEVVTDNVTHLMWQDNNDTKSINKNWSDAKEYCKNLILGGYSDWRLPSIEELYSITDMGRYDPAIDPAFKNVVSYGYWSSTTDVGDTSAAWNVDFLGGGDYWDDKSHTDYVRCVRHSDN